MSDSANKLTNDLLIEIPKRFVGARVWRQNTGGGIGMSTVKRAIGLLKAHRVTEAIALLSSRIIKWGVKGGGDVSGVLPVVGVLLRDMNDAQTLGIRIELEVKADGDVTSEDQKAFRSMILSAGGIYIEVRSVERALEELGRWV